MTTAPFIRAPRGVFHYIGAAHLTPTFFPLRKKVSENENDFCLSAIYNKVFFWKRKLFFRKSRKLKFLISPIARQLQVSNG